MGTGKEIPPPSLHLILPEMSLINISIFESTHPPALSPIVLPVTFVFLVLAGLLFSFPYRVFRRHFRIFQYHLKIRLTHQFLLHYTRFHLSFFGVIPCLLHERSGNLYESVFFYSLRGIDYLLHFFRIFVPLWFFELRQFSVPMLLRVLELSAIQSTLYEIDNAPIPLQLAIVDLRYGYQAVFPKIGAEPRQPHLALVLRLFGGAKDVVTDYVPLV